MTTIHQFQRLEASGLWRASARDNPKQVIVSVGSTSLSIMDMNETVLSHWSLAAIRRRNPTDKPAIFSPGLDAEEQVEIDDETMVETISVIREKLIRRGTRSRWLKIATIGGLFAAIVFAAFIYLPQALIAQTSAMTPPAIRQDLSTRVWAEMQRGGATRCSTLSGDRALEALARRLGYAEGNDIWIVKDAFNGSRILPDGTVLASSSLITKYDDPDQLSGFLAVSDLKRRLEDPFLHFLTNLGPSASAQLMFSGNIANATIAAHAKRLQEEMPKTPDLPKILTHFKEQRLSTRGYGYGRDPTGETTIEIIEADPFPSGPPEPILPERQWLALTQICVE